MQERRRRYLTAEQLEALADAAGSGRVAVLVLGYCGLRWSELAALRVQELDLLRRQVLVEAVTEVDGSRLVWGHPPVPRPPLVPLPRFSPTYPAPTSSRCSGCSSTPRRR